MAVDVSVDVCEVFDNYNNFDFSQCDNDQYKGDFENESDLNNKCLVTGKF